MAKLTDKQENFCVSYINNGGNATQAYKDHYNIGETATDNSIWVQAHELLHSSKVSVRVHELRTMKISKKILTIEERKQLLTEWAMDGDAKSIEILNKMEGVYIDKVEHSGSIIKRTINVNPTKDKK